MLVLAGLGALVADVVLEVLFSDEFFDLILDRNAFFCGVANISVISIVLVLVSFRTISPHRIRPLVDSRVLCGQEYILTRPRQVGEVIILAQRGSNETLIRALGLLLVGVWRLSAISALALLVLPILLGGLKLS